MTSKREFHHKKSTMRPLWLLLAAVVFASLALWFLTDSGGKKKNNSQSTFVRPGRVDACAKNPAFPARHGLQPPYLIDLRQADGPGLKILEARKNGKVLQLDSWKKFGTLGAYTLDKDGAIYTAPIPFVNLAGHSPLHFNQLLKVNPQTGDLEKFMPLPFAKPPGQENPYGVVGMTYDCDNHSIYVASIAGSDADSEVGRIYHIDLRSKKILHRLDGFDALGLGVFRMKSGKRLYLGHARSPEVFSIALDDKGGFVGRPRFEFSLAALEGGSSDNAHRIRFLDDHRMKVKGIEFNYSLMAASEPQRNIYKFKYNPQKDDWDFIEANPQQQ